MLIRFMVSNFLSFNSEQEFSMNIGNSTKYKERIKENKDQSILKFAALYGANASGKSNFVKAIDFSKTIILSGIENMNYGESHFKLNPENIDELTKFEYELMIDEKYYAYGFHVDLHNRKVVNEWLVELKPNEETLIFERSIKENYFDCKLKFEDENDEMKLGFLSEDVNNIENVLLLSEFNRRKSDIKELEVLKKIYSWFSSKLEVIYPTSVISGVTRIFNNSNIDLARLLKYFDTGIEGIENRKSSFEEISEYLPKDIYNIIVKDLEKKKNKSNKNNLVKELGVLRLQDLLFEINISEDLIDIKEILLKHNENDKVAFTYGEESDGTRRLIELLNVVYTNQEGKTIIIDELDRSLHPQLTIKFVETFLKLSEKQSTQLIITTHESNLMDLNILRRDEIWFVERNHKLNESNLYSLERYKVHNTKKVVKDYLIGRYGAVPVFKDFESYLGD